MADGVTENAAEKELSAETIALAEKGRSGTIETPDPLVKLIPAPAGTPEKFWDPVKGELRTEDLIKSYSELEKKVGAPKEETAEVTEEVAEEVAEETTEEVTEETEEVAEETTEEVTPELGAAIETAQAVFAETGDLPDEAREPLRKLGITDEQIDIQIQGVKAIQAALEAAISEPFGGREGYDEAVAWAAQNWTPKQIEAFNAQTGTVDSAKIAGAMLHAAYTKANPGEGKLANINSGVNHGDVYTSMADFNEDLRKADAVRDQNARNKAVEKLRRSRAARSIK